MTEGGTLAIEVAPLTLPGVTEAVYTITVTNGPNQGGEVVWQRQISSSQFGDGAGSVSYVGTCDASTGVNTVQLDLDALYAGAAEPITDYFNPTPVSQEVTCVENGDVSVSFDMTIARQASQGFFDVAVEFSNIFCSAKLDCGATTAAADDLNLLPKADGTHGMTAVIGFACTGDPSVTGQTHMYLDNVHIDCGAVEDYAVIDVGGRGNVDLSLAPSSNSNNYLFGAVVYRGAEGLAQKGFWNIALGINTPIPNDACTVRLEGTASPEAFDARTSPENAVYPIVKWEMNLTDAGARVCTEHAIDGTPAGVATDYLPLGTRAQFDYHYDVVNDVIDPDPNGCGGDLDGDWIGELCDTCPGVINPSDVAGFYSDAFDSGATVDLDRWSDNPATFVGSSALVGGALALTVAPTATAWTAGGARHTSRVTLVGDFAAQVSVDSSGVGANNADSVQTQLRLVLDGTYSYTFGDRRDASPAFYAWTNIPGCSALESGANYAAQTDYRLERVGDTLTASYRNASTAGAWTSYASCAHAGLGGWPATATLQTYPGASGSAGTHTTRFDDFGLVTDQDDQRDTDGDGVGDVCLPGGRLWHFSAGSLAALGDGSAVTGWPDLSGHGYDAFQTTASLQPVYTANAVGTRGAVTFDGADDVLGFPGPGTTTSAMTLFVVYRAQPGATGNAYYPLTIGGEYVGNVDDGTFIGLEMPNGLSGDSEDVIDIIGGSSHDARATSPAIAGYGTVAIVSAVTSGTIYNTAVYDHGAAATMSTTGSADVAMAINLSDADGTNRSGIGGVAVGGYFKGEIFEVLVYDRALSAAERQAGEAYLMGLYDAP